MTDFSDELMRERLTQTRPFVLVMLHKTALYDDSSAVRATVWEHGRRNFVLREQGDLAVVLPCVDGSEWAGFGLFDGTVEHVRGLMDTDPAVVAGIFTYEAHEVRGFPGDGLPTA